MFEKSFTAGEDIPAHRLVTFSSDEDTVIIAESSDVNVLGVTTDVDTTAGNTFDVSCIGYVKIQAGGTVTKGDFIEPDSDGKGVTSSAGNYFCAIALEDADEDEYFNAVIERGITPSTAADTDEDTDEDADETGEDGTEEE